MGYVNTTAEASGVNRKRSYALQGKERRTVLSAFLYIKTKTPEHSMTWVASETATATSISRVSLFEIRKEAHVHPLVISCTKKERRRV
jgi:hypothetical protein